MVTALNAYKSLAATATIIGLAVGLSVGRSSSDHIAMADVVVSPPADDCMESSVCFYSISPRQRFLSSQAIHVALAALGGASVAPEDIESVRSRLSITPVGAHAMHRYRVTFRHSSAEYALGLLETHLAHFVASERERTLVVARAEVEFLSDQRRKIERAHQRTHEKYLRVSKQIDLARTDLMRREAAARDGIKIVTPVHLDASW